MNFTKLKLENVIPIIHNSVYYLFVVIIILLLVQAWTLIYIFFSGDVELKNMQLRPEALNALKLPVKVKAGFLGSVRLKVGEINLFKCLVYKLF